MYDLYGWQAVQSVQLIGGPLVLCCLERHRLNTGRLI